MIVYVEIHRKPQTTCARFSSKRLVIMPFDPSFSFFKIPSQYLIIQRCCVKHASDIIQLLELDDSPDSFLKASFLAFASSAPKKSCRNISSFRFREASSCTTHTVIVLVRVRINPISPRNIVQTSRYVARGRFDIELGLKGYRTYSAYLISNIP